MTMMNELIYSIMKACQEAFRGVWVYKAQMIPPSSSPIFQCLKIIISCLPHALLCDRPGRMRISKVWYADSVVPLPLNVLTEALNV